MYWNTVILLQKYFELKWLILPIITVIVQKKKLIIVFKAIILLSCRSLVVIKWNWNEMEKTLKLNSIFEGMQKWCDI